MPVHPIIRNQKLDEGAILCLDRSHDVWKIMEPLIDGHTDGHQAFHKNVVTCSTFLARQRTVVERYVLAMDAQQ